MSALQEWSLRSPTPAELLHTSPYGLQCQMFQGLLLPMPDSQAGEPDEGFQTLLWKSLYDIIIFQSVGHPLGEDEIAYITNVPLLPYHCGFFFVFGCRISFLAVFSLFY